MDELKSKLEGVRSEFLPDGRIEIVSEKDKAFERYLDLGLSSDQATSLVIETALTRQVIHRLSNGALLLTELESDKGNVGILSAVARKVLPEIQHLV